MKPIEISIQNYLDACQDECCFCDGIVYNLSIPKPNEVLSNKPNCGVKETCPLFRSPMGRVRKKWMPQGSDPDQGCDSYKNWIRYQQKQVEESQEWVVSMADETRVITGRDPLRVAIKMFFLLREQGIMVDKMDLLEKRYSVREK